MLRSSILCYVGVGKFGFESVRINSIRCQVNQIGEKIIRNQIELVMQSDLDIIRIGLKICVCVWIVIQIGLGLTRYDRDPIQSYWILHPHSIQNWILHRIRWDWVNCQILASVAVQSPGIIWEDKRLMLPLLLFCWCVTHVCLDATAWKIKNLAS